MQFTHVSNASMGTNLYKFTLVTNVFAIREGLWVNAGYC